MMLIEIDDETLRRLLSKGVLIKDGAVFRDHDAPQPVFRSPADVAVEFRFYQRGRKEVLTELTDELEEMERVGFSMDAIHRDIIRPDRDKSERFWMMKARLRPRQTDRLAGTKAFLAGE